MSTTEGAAGGVRGEMAGDLRWALFGGALAAVIVFVAVWLVGGVSSAEARRLVAALLPTLQFAASAYIAGGATVLALMLAMISFSMSHESEFRESHYGRLRMIATLTSALIVLSILILMLLSVPITESETAADWYDWFYFGILFVSSLAGGLMIALVMMLNYAVRGLIDLGRSGTSFLTVDDGDASPRRDDPSPDPSDPEAQGAAVVGPTA